MSTSLTANSNLSDFKGQNAVMWILKKMYTVQPYSVTEQEEPLVKGLIKDPMTTLTELQRFSTEMCDPAGRTAISKILFGLYYI